MTNDPADCALDERRAIKKSPVQLQRQSLETTVINSVSLYTMRRSTSNVNAALRIVQTTHQLIFDWTGQSADYTRQGYTVFTFVCLSLSVSTQSHWFERAE